MLIYEVEHACTEDFSYRRQDGWIRNVGKCVDNSLLNGFVSVKSQLDGALNNR
jgi:hypothetical protein